jgi:uncharacterized protein
VGQTPPVVPGRRVIDGYGGGGFRVAGETHRGSILIFPGAVAPWPVADIAALTIESLAPILYSDAKAEILLIGCGRKTVMIAPALRQAARERGVVIDAMDTGAACRTYNVLLGEERRVAAALIAVD